MLVITPNRRKRDNPQRHAGRRKGSFPEEWLVAQGFPGGALGTATEIRKLQQISPMGEQNILLRGKNRDVVILRSHPLKNLIYILR